VLQSAALARAAGADESRVRSATDLNAALYALAMRESDPAAIMAEGKRIMGAAIDADASLSVSDKAEARKGMDRALAELTSPWFRTFLGLDPAAFLGKLRMPVLALNGSRDLQVPANENVAGIEAALKSAGNTGYRLIQMDGLNHLFQHATSGLPEEYGKLTGTFAPEALAAIRDFVLSAR